MIIVISADIEDVVDVASGADHRRRRCCCCCRRRNRSVIEGSRGSFFGEEVDAAADAAADEAADTGSASSASNSAKTDRRQFKVAPDFRQL